VRVKDDAFCAALFLHKMKLEINAFIKQEQRNNETLEARLADHRNGRGTCSGIIHVSGFPDFEIRSCSGPSPS
jgi:hypothetical protein